MSISSIHSAIARIAVFSSTFMEGQARAGEHAETVRYLSGLPDYLREDIGLLDHADILDAVERGRLHAAVGYETRHPVIVAPHSA